MYKFLHHCTSENQSLADILKKSKPVSPATPKSPMKSQVHLKSPLRSSTHSSHVTSPVPPAANDLAITHQNSTCSPPNPFSSSDTDDIEQYDTAPVRVFNDMSIRDGRLTDVSHRINDNHQSQAHSVEDITQLSGGSLMRALVMNQDSKGYEKSVNLDEFKIFPAGRPICTARRKPRLQGGAAFDSGRGIRHGASMTAYSSSSDVSSPSPQREPAARRTYHRSQLTDQELAIINSQRAATSPSTTSEYETCSDPEQANYAEIPMHRGRFR